MPTGRGTGAIAGGQAPAGGTYVIVARDTRRASGNVRARRIPLAPARPGDPPGGAGRDRALRSRPRPRRARRRAARRATVFVDSRGRALPLAPAPAGPGPHASRAGARRGPVLRVSDAARPSGLYVLDAARGTYRARCRWSRPGTGRQKRAGRAAAITWQGLNRVDDDGDGLPNTLGARRPRPPRPPARRLAACRPASSPTRAPLLRLLDRPAASATTSRPTAALARPATPSVTCDGHGGVVLAGDARWLGRELAERAAPLRRARRAGVLARDRSLRRRVRLRGGLLERAQRRARPPTCSGRRLAPLARRKRRAAGRGDRIGLFEGGDGLFRGFERLRGHASARARAPASCSAAQTAEGRR